MVTQKISKLNSLNSTQSYETITNRANHQRSNSSVVPSKNVKQLIQETFENFKNKHQNVVDKTKNREKLIKKQDKFIGNLRSSLFSTGFIKSLIFNAWKNLIKNKFEV